MIIFSREKAHTGDILDEFIIAIQNDVYPGVEKIDLF
jgi:hypothetical protein